MNARTLNFCGPCLTRPSVISSSAFFLKVVEVCDFSAFAIEAGTGKAWKLCNAQMN